MHNIEKGLWLYSPQANEVQFALIDCGFIWTDHVLLLWPEPTDVVISISHILARLIIKLQTSLTQGKNANYTNRYIMLARNICHDLGHACFTTIIFLNFHIQLVCNQ